MSVTPATPGQISDQSTAISKVRQTVGLALANLTALQGNLLTVAALGGFDAFDPGAFAGNNGDIAASDLDAANTAVSAVMAAIYSAPGVPNINLMALAKVAQ